MNYKDAYIHEVGQLLPEKTREDIQNEIRSLIEDTLDDASHAAGRPADDAMLLDVLRQLGPPDKMAASYLPPRYLIGPTLFPAFIATLRIVITVMVIIGAVGMGISLGAGAYLPGEVYTAIGEAVGELFGGILSAIGMVVVIFAVIQWAAPNAVPGTTEQKPWDPSQLKPVGSSDKVGIAEPVASIIFNVLFLTVLLVFPEWLGLSTFRDGAWIHMPLMTPAFFSYVRWFAVLIALEVIQYALLLGRGRWTAAIRWFGIAVAVLTIGLGIRILTGPALIDLSAAAVAQMGWGSLDAASAERITDALNQAARIVIGIVIAFQFVEIGKHLYRLFGKRLPVLEIGGQG